MHVCVSSRLHAEKYSYAKQDVLMFSTALIELWGNLTVEPPAGSGSGIPGSGMHDIPISGIDLPGSGMHVITSGHGIVSSSWLLMGWEACAACKACAERVWTDGCECGE